MIDTIALLKSIDLAQLIERDAGEIANSHKRVPCPFCQTTRTGGPAMQIYSDRYHCFGCGAHGDAIDYIQQRDNVEFLEACARLGWKGETQPSEEIQRAKVARITAKLEADRKRAEKLDEILAEYSIDEIWGAYNRRMGEEQKTWWASQGVPEDWQNYLQLGYTPMRNYYDKDGSVRQSPAYTIPYFHSGFTFQNIQYRLQDPANPKDRYRFEHGLKTTYYMTLPSDELQDFCIICEGAKKAMVARILGDTGDKTTVLGIPSKVDYGGVAEYVKECKRVWIVLDPDAWDKPKHANADWKPSPIKLAERIGKAARIVKLPFKSDDGFLLYGMTAAGWKETLRGAPKA